MELTEFVDQSLKVDADSYDHRATPHITKQARLGANGIVFPLKARYGHANLTLEGLTAELSGESDQEGYSPGRASDVPGSQPSSATDGTAASDYHLQQPRASPTDVMCKTHSDGDTQWMNFGFRIRKSSRPAGFPPKFGIGWMQRKRSACSLSTRPPWALAQPLPLWVPGGVRRGRFVRLL
jgi:hypothetical protein